MANTAVCRLSYTINLPHENYFRKIYKFAPPPPPPPLRICLRFLACHVMLIALKRLIRNYISMIV